MDDLDLIKQKINLVDLIQEYLPLKRAGINFKAPCPFHQEKTPSFVVSPERGIWHCFGCSKGGDHFKFLMEKEGIEFTEALEILAKKAGIVLKKRSGATGKKTRLLEVNQKAAEFFHYILTKHPLGKNAREYLEKRGLTKATIELFQLGYAPNSWENLTKFLLKRKFTIEEIVEAGLAVPSRQNGYDRFRGRVIFPMIDTKGDIIGFAGRILGKGEPKYINTPQTPIFDKGNFLFGLNIAKGEIRNKNQAILVEGEMDMILSFQSGVGNVVASKGTALTSGQVELIKKYTDSILLCFDKDLAGDSAARRGIEMADQAGLNIKVIKLPNGKDPAELALKKVEAWKKSVEDAEPIYDYYIASVAQRYNPKLAEGKRKIATELVPIWSKISDPLTREHYTQKLAALLGVSEEMIRKEIARVSSPRVFTPQPGPKVDLAVAVRTRRELLEEYLLALLLRIPSDLTFVPSFPETLFISETYRSLYVLLVLYLDTISFKAKSFEINEFVKTLPLDLVNLVDRLYLVEIDDKLANSRIWSREIEKAVEDLKKALIRSSLEKLSAQIKSAEMFGKIELLESLNKRFRDLSVKLKTL